MITIALYWLYLLIAMCTFVILVIVGVAIRGIIKASWNLLTGDRVMSKRLSKDGMPLEVLDDIFRLKNQVACSIKGHKITLSRTWIEPGTAAEPCRTIEFECSLCRLSYFALETDLTKKEKALLDAFDMKE